MSNLRRGRWEEEKPKLATIKSDNKGARPAKVYRPGVANSEVFIQNREINSNDPKIPNTVSDQRQGELIRATAGLNQTSNNKSAPSPIVVNSQSYKQNQQMKAQFIKNAGVTVGGSSSSSSGGTVRMGPEVYSPLFQIANLQLPRDRITMNAWNRNFYDTNPIVHNCINLHATYPINKINIKCKDQKIEQFFNDMIENLDLMNALQMIALEFWCIGEVFPFLDLDENKGIWKALVIQNPDYIHVKTSVLSGEPIISMRPDAALQRLVMSNNPADMKLKSQISEEILFHVRKGNNIPLDNFHISHLKLLSHPYDIHGTSPIVSVYKQLMHFDKLLECHDEKTEVLTNHGFKKYNEVIEIIEEKPQLKSEYKIACFNKETEKVQFEKPSNVHLSDYEGEMYHFTGNKVDICVTPNHRMLAGRMLSTGWSDWEVIQAKDMSSGTKYRLRSTANWDGNDAPKTVNIGSGKEIPTDLYLKVLGYIISEGCVSYRTHGKYTQYSLSVTQNFDSDCFDDIFDSFSEFGSYFNKKLCRYERKDSKVVTGFLTINKNIYDHLVSETGTNGVCRSRTKRIPRWILNLKKEYLKIILNSLVNGDGSDIKYKHTNGFKYHTLSNSLADDVYELVFKCGYSPTKYISKTIKSGDSLYCVGWSNTNNGIYPNIYGNSKERLGRFNKIQYSGKVWCFEVPTGFFVTRRNGKITIQGNCKFSQADELVNPITLVQIGGTADGEYRATADDLEHWRQTFEDASYDKNFRIISHAGVKVDKIGNAGAVIDVSNDLNFIVDCILYGLMVPKAILTQEGASFNNASIGLEVLKQRYETFRNMMAQWLTKKVFAPISEIQEFYEYSGGDKKLIVPEIEWNKMILFDMDNYINTLKGLADTGKVSQTTLFKSLGLNIEEERRHIKEEMVRQTILSKENSILQGMSLGALRSIKPDEDIVETSDIGIAGVSQIPGTPGFGEESGKPGADLSGLLGGGMGIPGVPEPMPVGGPTMSGGMPSAPTGPGAGELGSGGPAATPATPPPTPPAGK